jgi:hypothetical protein
MSEEGELAEAKDSEEALEALSSPVTVAAHGPAVLNLLHVAGAVNTNRSKIVAGPQAAAVSLTKRSWLPARSWSTSLDFLLGLA